MSRFLSERFEKLRAYTPGEQPRDFSYIKLNTNESPYPPAPKVVEAIGQRAIEDLRLYCDPECRYLREALAAHFDVTTANIVVGNGSDEILSFAFMAFCDKHIGVSYPDISYGFYPVFAELYGLAKTEHALRNDFTVNPEDYFNAGATIILANPNAPTGCCLPVMDIERIVRANPNNVVVVDEAYIDFGGESCIPLTKSYDNLIVVQTFSKSRSLAGARLGFAVGSAELVADLERLRYSTNPYNVNSLTLLAGTAALSQQDYYDIMNCKIVQNREYTGCELLKLGFELTDSKANFIFAKHPRLSGQALYQGLRARGILVRHFSRALISDYVRITIGTREQMETLINTLGEMLD